ncbi:hypothetical protein [Caballeronia sp. dw_276]|uniref:hypothetical protein n=1 Tax=Caballeronia sp. dw_276 TaxID=2719795 RepID=UPI001BD66818|nr:hypothetical protein [Caballeronia sp. dw_276]
MQQRWLISLVSAMIEINIARQWSQWRAILVEQVSRLAQRFRSLDVQADST